LTTEEIVKLAISSVLPLLGVIIGGLITFYIQKNSLGKTHAFEREKIRLDNIAKDEEEKFKAYNRILLNNALHKVWEWDPNKGGEIDYAKYIKYIRPVLFDVFHLLDKKVADELDFIEQVYERQHYEEDEQIDDRKDLSDSYLNIIAIIKQQFKNHRESNNS